MGRCKVSWSFEICLVIIFHPFAKPWTAKLLYSYCYRGFSVTHLVLLARARLVQTRRSVQSTQSASGLWSELHRVDLHRVNHPADGLTVVVGPAGSVGESEGREIRGCDLYTYFLPSSKRWQATYHVQLPLFVRTNQFVTTVEMQRGKVIS